VTADGVAAALAQGTLDVIDQAALADWIGRQRWYATKGRGIGQASVVQALPLDGEPPLVLAIVALRFASGTHDLYQMPIGLHRAVDGLHHEPICEAGGWIVHEALAEPEHCKRLARLLSASAMVERPTGRVEFHGLPGSAPLAAATRVRTLTGEQTNTSLVFDEQVVLKVFRRLAAGTNPELEMLRFLSAHGFENIAELVGWFEHRSELIDATLGIAVRHVAGARNGWELTLDALAAGEGEALMASLAELGTVTGRMHTLLGSDAADPDFAPEEANVETTALLAATIDEHLERTLDDRPDDPALQPIAHRSEELREYVRHAAQGANGGRLIRHHGDFHLGQTLAVRGGWVIVDFEGEPARSLLERRRKRSALRDVACMLRSFAYAAAVAELQRGVRPPADWERHARQTFVEAYLDTVDPSLLPPDRAAIEQTLAFLELEKAVYELRYEVDHRPDWVPIPVAALSRLLEARAT
jgi:trehalose synthase-fused probable maltokinase